MKRQKLTSELFISRSTKEHGSRYGYSLVSDPINVKSNVDIICSTHGVFTQIAGDHMNGHGCSKCAGLFPLTEEEFLRQSNIIHNNFYGYGKFVFIDAKTKGIIICPDHGEFPQVPKHHLNGRGCPDCGRKKANLSLTTPFSEFKLEAVKLRPDEFEYFEEEYKNKQTPTKIRCIKHNHIFYQTPKSHLKGSECPICENENHPSHQKKTNEQFLKEIYEIHGNLFTYKSEYIGAHEYITIQCNECNTEFDQLAYVHLSGRGCPNCILSVGEKSIRLYLERNNIEYTKQKTFDDCRSPKNRMLKFDFFIPHNNLLIEFDGKQHFELSNIRGYKTTQDELDRIKIYDSIKNEYAKSNNIKLLRIPYWDIRKIPEILKENIIS
jgi:protein-arginine kinase activator protein McsA